MTSWPQPSSVRCSGPSATPVAVDDDDDVHRAVQLADHVMVLVYDAMRRCSRRRLVTCCQKGAESGDAGCETARTREVTHHHQLTLHDAANWTGILLPSTRTLLINPHHHVSGAPYPQVAP